MIRYLFVFIILAFILFSCKGKASVLENAERIEIYFPVDDTAYKFIDTSILWIEEFNKVLDGKEEKRHCKTDGEIRFYSKDSIVFSAGYAISDSECQYLMREDKSWKLTYRAGMYLNELRYRLLQKNGKNN